MCYLIAILSLRYSAVVSGAMGISYESSVLLQGAAYF